jgi:hypothetical protein
VYHDPELIFRFLLNLQLSFEASLAVHLTNFPTFPFIWTFLFSYTFQSSWCIAFPLSFYNFIFFLKALMFHLFIFWSSIRFGVVIGGASNVHNFLRYWVSFTCIQRENKKEHELRKE